MNQAVGQYLIERLVSTGGMATLFLGRHRDMGRQVVIKQLHPHLARDEALVRRFEREARILGGLRHPNIVDIIDFFQHQGSSFIVLEYIEGCSLDGMLVRRSPVPVVAAAFIANQIAQGLQYAHAQGVVHRDIKPANVMFTAAGVVKIADFGLAFAKEALSLTDPGTFFGTPAYLAPEQIRGSKGDERSDLFSFGVVLYQMLAGSNPFAGESHSECIDRVLRLKPARVSSANPKVPPGMESLVAELLDKEPGRRPESAAAVAARLEPYVFIAGEGLARFLADPPGYSPRKEDQQALDRLARKERRLRAAVRHLTAAALMAAVAAASWAFIKWGLPAAGRFFPRQAMVTATPATDSAVAVVLPPAVKGRRLRISGTTGAAVSIDGTHRGFIPLSIEGISPGKHRVRAVKDGFQPLEEALSIDPDRDADLALNLSPVAVPPGYLSLAVSPWAEVYIDGRFVDRTPLTAPVRIEAGKRQLVLRHPNRKEYVRDIEIPPGDTTRLTVSMPQAWGYLKLTVKPWANVFIDGEGMGTTPSAQPLKVSIGSHELRLVGPGGREWKETIRITENDTLDSQADLR